MQFEIGFTELSEAIAETPQGLIPWRILFLLTFVSIVFTAAVFFTPWIFGAHYTWGDFEVLVIGVAIVFLYGSLSTHRKVLGSYSTDQGIVLICSEIPGLFAKRQVLEELLAWHDIEQFSVIENEGMFWLTATLKDKFTAGLFKKVTLNEFGFSAVNELTYMQKLLTDIHTDYKAKRSSV